MTERKYTSEDLKEMQAWPLERKIQVTQTRLIEWYQYYDGKVYVSFSGGKDSTVLLDMARRIHPNIEAVFIDIDRGWVVVEYDSHPDRQLIKIDGLDFGGIAEKVARCIPL